MLNRTMLPWELSLREAPDGGDVIGHIEGRAVPYGQTIDLGGITETFARGAVDPSDLVGAPLLWQHERGEVVGTITDAHNGDDGAYFTASIIGTSRGRDALVALRSGAVKGLSVGFERIPDGDTWSGNAVTRSKVRVREVSVATIPAYPDAEALAVRQQEQESTMQDAPEVPQVDLSTLATREDLTALESRMSASLQVREPVEQTLDVREAFAKLVQTYGKDRQTRALADMVSSGNTGLTSTARTSKEVLDLFDATRYFVSHVASMAFPTEGITHTLPKKTQRSTVGSAAEKAEAPSRAITTTTEAFTGEWYKGALDISYELIRTSSPAAVSFAVKDMLEEAALESEQKFVTAAEAASTLAANGLLDFTSYESFIIDVRAGVRAIRAATRNVTPKFALTPDSWDKLLTFVDTTDRRQFATIGSTNADGSAGLASISMTVGGIEFFESPESTVDLAFNDVSLLKSELAPLTLSSDNVALIGRDVGVLGNIMCIDRVPAGILRFAAA